MFNPVFRCDVPRIGQLDLRRRSEGAVERALEGDWPWEAGLAGADDMEIRRGVSRGRRCAGQYMMKRSWCRAVTNICSCRTVVNDGDRDQTLEITAGKRAFGHSS